MPSPEGTYAVLAANSRDMNVHNTFLTMSTRKRLRDDMLEQGMLSPREAQTCFGMEAHPLASVLLDQSGSLLENPFSSLEGTLHTGVLTNNTQGMLMREWRQFLLDVKASSSCYSALSGTQRSN